MRDELWANNRPTWDHSFMSMAFEWSKRSHDAETQVGAFLTNCKHEPLSGGYNGFPRECDDCILPNKRPHKYEFMIHAEVNCILNAKKLEENTILYCTHFPCKKCLLFCWQAGVREIVWHFGGYTNEHLNNWEDYNKFLDKFKEISNDKLTLRQFSFSN